MYCRKCGTKIQSQARGCPTCGAVIGQNAPSGGGRRRTAMTALGGAVALAALVAFGLDRGGFFGGRVAPGGGANLAVADHQVRAHSWNAAAAEIPAANLLYLPHADRGFVGSWGGSVHIVSVTGDARSATTSNVPMSYFFGERNGEVYLKTRVYGDPKWPVVKTAVKVLGPKSVEFTLNSVCPSCMPPVSQTEKTRLTLTSANQLDAQCDTYAFASGGGHVDLKYAGVLHPLTQRELAQIDAQVRQQGKLLTTIDSKVPVNR